MRVARQERRSRGLVTRARCARALLDQLLRQPRDSREGVRPWSFVPLPAGRGGPERSEEPSRDRATCPLGATMRVPGQQPRSRGLVTRARCARALLDQLMGGSHVCRERSPSSWSRRQRAQRGAVTRPRDTPARRDHARGWAGAAVAWSRDACSLRSRAPRPTDRGIARLSRALAQLVEEAPSAARSRHETARRARSARPCAWLGRRRRSRGLVTRARCARALLDQRSRRRPEDAQRPSRRPARPPRRGACRPSSRDRAAARARRARPAAPPGARGARGTDRPHGRRVPSRS